MDSLRSDQMLDLVLECAAYEDDDVPECIWPSAEMLQTVDIHKLPQDGVVSIQLAEAFGDLPGVAAQARIYRTQANLKVLVTHDPPPPSTTTEFLKTDGYLRFLTNQVEVAPPGRARMNYYNAEAIYPDWLAEYSIEVEGQNLYELGLQGHRIAHSIEAAVDEKLSHIEGVFGDLAGAGRLVTSEDIDRVDRASSKHEKGVALEDLIAHLFVSLGGFRLDPAHGRNLRTENSEIDHVFQNLGVSAPWARGSALVLTECKNWSSVSQRSVLDSFETKIRDRGGQCRVGVFISWAGFSEGFETELIRAARESFLILTMDGAGIRRAVEEGDFRGYVQARYDEAISR